MRAKALFFLGWLIGVAPICADRAESRSGALTLNDIDGHTLSTADGHVTVLVVATKENLAKAEAVGARVPDFCLGNPEYRMVTLVKFGKQIGPIRSFLAAMTRQRLDTEAQDLQKRYAAHKIDKNARADIFAVTDFDDSVSAQLGGESSGFHVLVFGRHGELLRQWNDVPSAEELAAALKS